MGTAYGFVTTSPDTRFGDVEGSFSANNTLAAKFTLAESGTFDISEVGLYTSGVDSSIVLGIFAHDAANNCPGALVTNAQSDALGPMSGTVAKWAHTYGTKPQLTSDGTTVYWIAAIGTGASGWQPSRFADGTGSALYITTGLTYPTWPDDTAWHTHTDQTHRYSFYAVYAEAATGQFARPSSDVAGGTFRSIVTTAPFGPRVIA